MNILALAVCVPWMTYGQSLLPPDTLVINPATLSAGLMGEQSFPYTVPTGKVLVIDRVAIESHWGSGMWLWTGSTPFTWEKALETYKAEERLDPSLNSMPTVEWFPTKYVPAGVTINVALVSQNQPNSTTWRQGWEVSGRLCDLPD